MVKLHIDCIIILFKNIHIHTRIFYLFHLIDSRRILVCFGVALINVNKAMLQAIAIC